MPASYPNTQPNFGVDIPKGSVQLPVEDLVVDQWPNGNIRGRSYFATGKYKWTLIHTPLADADKVTLKTFYDTNKLLTFDFVSPFDAVTYHNVIFAAPPDYKRLAGPNWIVTVQLQQAF